MDTTQPPVGADRTESDTRLLDDRVALVTGSSKGIGAAIACTFARLGARVVVHGRRRADAERVAARIQAEGGTAMVALGDVTRAADLTEIRRCVEAGLGPVDILVANAGASLTPPVPLEQIPEQGWRDTVEGNLTATFLTVKCFLPGMKRRRHGTIITIASSAGRQANSRVPIPYAAAKAGIALLTQNLAAQVGPSGIRANCIAPETILTEGNRQRIPEAQQAAIAAYHPLQRLGTPDDVAEAAAFLASERSSWVTGIVLDVAGGAVLV